MPLEECTYSPFLKHVGCVFAEVLDVELMLFASLSAADLRDGSLIKQQNMMSTSTDAQTPTILDLSQLLNDALGKVKLPGPTSQAKNVSVPIATFQEITRLVQSISQLAAGTSLPTIDSPLKLILQLLQNSSCGRAISTEAEPVQTAPTPTTPKTSRTPTSGLTRPRPPREKQKRKPHSNPWKLF